MRLLMAALVVTLSGCSMFESSTRTQAMADGVQVLSTEHDSIATAFEATLDQLLTKNASDAVAVRSLMGIKAQVQISRITVAGIQKDMLAVLSSSGLDDDVKAELLGALRELISRNSGTEN